MTVRGLPLTFFILCLTNPRSSGIVMSVGSGPHNFFYVYYYGGYIMRTRVTLACTECKQRNYNTTKDKKTHPDRMELKKYCRFCKKHTLHRETK